MCRNSANGNKDRYKIMRNKTEKVFSKAMRGKAEQGLAELRNCKTEFLDLLVD